MNKFTNEQIDGLRMAVAYRMSPKRYKHTLNVEDMAVMLGKIYLPDKLDVIRVAALLHDISKEYSEAEHLSLIERHNVIMSEDDRAVPLIWHSITGPLVVMEDFSEFACDEVFSAIRNHTVGDPDMSLLDEIILLADYIELGRSYGSCVALRNKFLAETSDCENLEDYIRVLHITVAESLDNNIESLRTANKKIHSKTKLTRDAIYRKVK